MSASTYYAEIEGGETTYTVTAAGMKFGAGALSEVGADAKALGMTRVAFYTDPNVVETEPAENALRSLCDAGLDVAVFEACRVGAHRRVHRRGDGVRAGGAMRYW